MAQRCILKVRAQMDGAIREPGYVFTLPTGKLGPHRAVSSGPHTINYDPGVDANHVPAPAQNVPLYDVIEEIPDHPAPVSKISAAVASEPPADVDPPSDAAS